MGLPYPGNVEGVLTFRGNPTRTYYGRGPVPRNPRVLWRFPQAPMCGTSTDELGTDRWCGTGWTGQPAVFERGGRTWLVFGAYDGAVHFLDAGTGERILPDLRFPDIVKGSVTVDPDGYPFVYTGARDGLYRVISFQGPRARVLWSINADSVSPHLWSNDWDGAALPLGDYLFEGGENSQFHVFKLNRGYGPGGEATVRPELVFHVPGWDDELLAAIRDTDVSIENSVAIFRDTVYFANSGGLVQGWDLSGVRDGVPPRRVFRFWTGDDTDASVVVDGNGALYVGSEWERHNTRSRDVGQIMKLDPGRGGNPLVWSLPDQGADRAGVWATPALYRDLVIVPTLSGRDLGIDRATGRVRWTKLLPSQTVASPVVVDGVWLQGDCTGTLRAFDLAASYPNEPKEIWSIRLADRCIESTPAVWKGRIYLGTRDGYEVAVGNLDAPTR